MAKTTHTEVDPKEVENARAMWLGFTKLMKWSVIAGAVTLLGLLLLVY